MCFNGYMSGGFAAIGLAAAWWVNKKTGNRQLAFGIFFFFLMEFLQVIQYAYLATGLDDPLCNDVINKVLTLLGFLHICCQPVFSLQISQALSNKPAPHRTPEHNRKLENYQSQYNIIKRLCWIGGFLLFMRYPLSFVPQWSQTIQQKPATEWLRGEKLCTFKTSSMVHLGWSVPMADPTYNIMGAGIHSFLMFAPFAAMGFDKPIMWVQGIVLYLTGPAMAAFITANLMEQASVWCFFSIAQIVVMLFLIRGTLVKGEDKQGVLSSGAANKDGGAVDGAREGKPLQQRVQAGGGNGKKNGNGNGNGRHAHSD